jgi:hypothetical protein
MGLTQVSSVVELAVGKRNRGEKSFMADDRLEKLKAKKQVIEDQIKQIENRKNAAKRKTENRRKFLLGSAVLSEMGNNPGFKRVIDDLIGRFLTRKEDRTLFDLPPLPDKNDGKKDDKTGG